MIMNTKMVKYLILVCLISITYAASLDADKDQENNIKLDTNGDKKESEKSGIDISEIGQTIKGEKI